MPSATIEEEERERNTLPKLRQSLHADESGYAEIVEQVRTKELRNRSERALTSSGTRERKCARTDQNEGSSASCKTLRRQRRRDQGSKKCTEGAKTSQELAIAKAVADAEKDKVANQKSIGSGRAQKAELATKSLEEKYLTQIKDRDDAIERLRDMKARLSTKMVESLEKYEIEFNKITTARFLERISEKDNDARTGSKGDFIFQRFR